MEDDEWQSAAFSSRHMHNRVHQGKHSRRNRPFDVYQTFGSYTCKCAAWERSDAARDAELQVTLELYRLTPNGEGVLGEIRFPGVLEAVVVLAASRKSLEATIDAIEEEEDGKVGGKKGGGDDEDEEEEEEDEENARFDTFEKNSFRAPKFWLQWNGALEGTETASSDRGYVVFSGNDCRKFKGTITCGEKGWKDVAISGHKMVGRKSSDAPISWNGRACTW